MAKYGVLIGRFQPLHLGHQMFINEILIDGLTPIILIGSVNKNRDKTKNPLSYKKRKKLIKLVYPNIDIKIKPLKDDKDWDKWFSNIEKVLMKFSKKREDFCFYVFNKESDRYDEFLFKGRIYKNEFYTKIFEDEGYKVKNVKFPNLEKLQIKINATDIRNNLEENKLFLDPRVYKKLKELKIFS